MTFKPTIFIGSSKEGLSVAERVSNLLSSFAECILWTDAFEFGISAYDNLISKIAFYDYAILIATGDDVTLSRNNIFQSPRDNVLFELGLFAGGLGRSRVFYVVEESTKIPSDLTGITLPFLPNIKSPDFETKVEEIVERIKKHILGKENTFDLGFLPSTALAYGYFTNFVIKTVERLLEDQQKQKKFKFENGKSFVIKQLKFTVLVPNDLRDDMFNKVKAKRLREGWKKLNVARKDIRDYDFSVDVSKADDGEMSLVDIPFTLNALNKAVELYSEKRHIGKTDKEELLESREIRNFVRTLQYLIQTTALTRGIVEVEVVNI